MGRHVPIFAEGLDLRSVVDNLIGVMVEVELDAEEIFSLLQREDALSPTRAETRGRTDVGEDGCT